MKKQTLEEVLDNLYLKYKYVNEETVWVENCKNYLCINWHTFMDGNVNTHIVNCIAKYLRKYTSKPIYASDVLLSI